MNRKIKLLGLSGFALTSLLGTILHYLYAFLGEAVWIAPFSGVNESTWEHMKLLFWPMLLFALVESFFFRDREDFFCVKLRGILIGLSLIPLIFYTYNGVIGKSPAWINIAIFFVAAFFAYLYETRKLTAGDIKCRRPLIPIIILVLIAIMFIVFTFLTPHINIFLDPITKTYGVS